MTHTRQSRSAFDGYNRGLQWERTCAEVAKLRIARGARREAVSAVVGADPLHAAAASVSSDDSEGNLAKPRGPDPRRQEVVARSIASARAPLRPRSGGAMGRADPAMLAQTEALLAPLVAELTRSE